LPEWNRPLMAATPLASLLKRDRIIVVASLAIITLLAWFYLWTLASQMNGSDSHSVQSGSSMQDMPGMAMPAMMPGFSRWTLSHAASQFAMWAVMMVGMMTPSVAPVVLIYARVADQAARQEKEFAPPMWFLIGYLLVWTLFALLATATQWGLERAALLTPMLVGANHYFGGGLLLLAGLYQWSPLKEVCLVHCRSPIAFVQAHGGFKAGIRGSILLGARHGAYCLGCCWMLMALLFVAGVMNLAWIAAIMVLVLLEKIAPYGRWIAKLAGGGALVAGAWMIAAG